MTTKEWLNRGREMDKEINALLEEKEKAFSRACSATAPTDHERVTTTRRNTSEDKFAQYAEYERRIDRMIDKLFQIKQEIIAAIECVNEPVYRTLLIKRYLNFKTWEQIAVEMNYSYRQTVRLHGKALQEVKMS